MPMLAAEIRRIVGRKGSFWSAAGIGLGAVVLMIIIRVANADDEDPGGTPLLEAMGPISLVATVMTILIGALAGSYDTAQGTMRYLVMTGVPRRRLYLVRAAGTVAATVLSCLPAIAVAVTAAFLTSHDAALDPSALDALGGVWAYLAFPLAYALVSVGVGSLLRSNGAAIGISLAFALGGTVITVLVEEYLSEGFASYLLPAVMPLLADLEGDADLSLGLAFAVAAAWVLAFLAAGLWRTEHDEY
jgi:ABC-type transport system involved in multi-copper enzyme maturation permease subunit